MKKIFALALAVWLPIAAAQEVRTWTSASGKTLEAAFVRIEIRPSRVAVAQRRKDENPPEPAQQRRPNLRRQPRPGRHRAGAAAAPAAEAEVPPALEALFGKRLVNAKGKKVSAATLAGKKIGIYFSASWCPPCRAFTPQLVAAYRQLQTEGQPFEVVLVPSDQNRSGHGKIHEGPRHAVARRALRRQAVQALKEKFAVAGIPKLVVVDAQGQTRSAEARGEVAAQGAAAYAGW
jgi:thiol-disulfide isomerase/thioredoxin